MSKGNSLVAGVVLIGMLTTLAVAFQSANPQVESDAQVAGAKFATTASLPPKAAPGVGSTKDPAGDVGDPQITTCEPGHDYKITQGGDGAVTECTAQYNCGTIPTQKNAGKSTKLKCKQGKFYDKDKKLEPSHPACQADGKIDYCLSGKLTAKQKESCVQTKCSPSGKDNISLKDLKDKNFKPMLKEELEIAGEKRAKEIANEAKLDSATQKEFTKAFVDEHKELGKEIEDLKQEGKDIAKDRDEALKRLQICYEATNYGPCEAEQEIQKNAQKQLEDNEKALKEAEERQKRLAAAAKALEPGKAPGKHDPTTGEKTPPGKPDPTTGEKTPDSGGGSPGGGSPGGGQPPQNTFPPPQPNPNQCSWFQSLFSSCPQLACTIQVVNQPQQQQPGQPQQPVTLQWQTTGGTAQYATITNLGTVPPNGQAQVNPQQTTTYFMNVQGQMNQQQGQGNQSAQCQTTVTVGGQQPGAPTLTFSAVPSSIAQGETSKLRWAGQNVTTCNATDGWSGTKSQSGEESVSPLKTTTYGLNCQGNTGSATRQVTVTVTSGPSSSGAEISCEPKIADVGMKIAIAYSCKNSVKAAGVGFKIASETETSGSAEVEIEKPPAGTDTVSYGLTCTASDGKETNASPLCKVQINKPSLILVANPKKIDTKDNKKDVTTLGWVSKGMKSCVISSPDLASFTEQNKNKKNVSGSLKTPELSKDTEFVLTCVTLADQEKVTSVTVEVD